MQTDFEILGIHENAGPAEIREAFHGLAKKIHPDVSKDEDALVHHLQFIRLNQAYRRLVRGSAPLKKTVVKKENAVHSGTPGIVSHKDPAYAYYKTAMTCFMKIHPSQWNIEVSDIMKKPHQGQEQELAKVQEKVRELVKLFPRAYYYFSIVVNDYPESVWGKDASDKMMVIEERTIRYRKIIESFTQHARIVPPVNRMFGRR